MKKGVFLQSLIGLLFVSCSVQEMDNPSAASLGDDVFYASVESNSTPDTKVYIDEDIKILWDEEDLISIFNKTTLNQKFMFAGETGDNAGFFNRISSPSGTGSPLGYICAVYPYLSSTAMSSSGILTLTLPAEQSYREDTFGRGANTMVSATETNTLDFKNVGGYLALKFYGDDISVSSIRLVGNNGEPLSGEATIQLPFDTDPELEMASTAGKSIFLNCEEPVQLGTTRDDATIFWMVVPPTDFTDGFTLLVSNPDGDVFIKETHVHLTIDRNGVLRIAPIKVDMNSEGLSIDSVSSADPDKLPSRTAYEGRTITVTMPTLNRSHLVLDYTFTGESLKVNGEDVVSGETPIDVTKPATLTVRSGSYGKNYTLVGCNTGLPVVRITTDGFTLADLESYENALESDDGEDHRVWLGSGTNTNVRIEYADGSPGLKIDKKPAYQIKTQIKGRGNYTWIWDKKPYAFKFRHARPQAVDPAGQLERPYASAKRRDILALKEVRASLHRKRRIRRAGNQR